MMLEGVRGRPIFYREDVLVNVHEVTDEQFYSARESCKDENVDVGEPQPGPSRQSQNTRSLFGGYINSALPFDEPPNDKGSYRKFKHSKSPRRSRSRCRSRSPYEKKSRRSRSSSEEPRYRERGYGKKPHNRERSPPLRPGEYRPKRRSRSNSKSPERRRRYKSGERSRSPDEKHRRAYKRRSKSVSPRRSPPYKRKEYRRTSKSPDSHRRRSPRETSPRSKYPGKNSGGYKPVARRSFSRERRVTHSPPLRPGEYRPPRKRSPTSPPLRRGEYRPPKNPNYYPVVQPAVEYIYYDGRMMPEFMPPFPVRIVPMVPPIRRPPFPMMNRPPRPPIVYNNRTIPKLVPNKEGTSNSGNDDNKSDSKKKDSDDHK